MSPFLQQKGTLEYQALICLLFGLSPIFAQSNLFYGLTRDTTICEGDYLYMALDPAVYNPLDTCWGNPEWSEGSGLNSISVFSSGEYWVYIDSINCPFVTDTINVTVTPCEVLCDQDIGHSGLFSVDGFRLFWSSIVEIRDGSGYYVSGVHGVHDSLLLAKFSLSGELEWISSIAPNGFGPYAESHAYHTLFLDHEGMLILGLQDRQLSVHGFGLLIKFDPATRQAIWMRYYKFVNANSKILSIVQDPKDGNYFISSSEGIFKVKREDGELIQTGFEPGTFENMPYRQLIVKDGYLYGCGYYKVNNENVFHLLLTKVRLDNGKEEWSFYSDTLSRISVSFLEKFPTMILQDQYLYGIAMFDNQVEQLQMIKFSLDGEIIWWKSIDFPEDAINVSLTGEPLKIVEAGRNIIVCLDASPSNRGDIILSINSDGLMNWAYAYYTESNTGIPSINAYDIAYNSGQLMYLSSIGASTLGTIENPRLMVGRIDTLGNALNSCMYYRIPEVIITDVENPVYYPFVIPESEHLNRNSVEYFTEVYPSSLYEFPACRALSLIYAYQTHALCPGQMIEGYTTSGVYADTFPSSQGCDSIRILTLVPGPAVHSSSKVIICAGDSYEGHDISGIYADTLQAASGCDSIHTLNLTVTPCLPIVHYDLDECRSYMSDASHMDYSEFVPSYPQSLMCGSVTGSWLHRDGDGMQKHSCTPGLNGTKAMCISMDTTCTYNAASASSLVFEVEVTPAADSMMALTGLTFYQKAPLSYNWIDGDTGPNDYPTRYGLRILRDDIEIYTSSSEETSLEWTEESFSFIGDSLFVTAESARYRFEFLPYCPVGNGAEVKAWDIEDVQVYGACLPRQKPDDKIAGQVYTVQHKPLKEASLYLRTQDPTASPLKATSDVEGQYSFQDLKGGGSYTLQGYDNKDHLKGVSTMDILRIQQHLLGKTLFTHQWQYIAGDVDRNERINVLDMIELRKTILGILPGFPGNTSWRFGTMPQQEDVPWLERFEEKAYIEQITQGVAVQDFLGIKVGDVNGDIQIRQRTKSSHGEEEMKTLKLHAMDVEDESTCVWQVRAGEELSYMGLQMALTIPEVDEVRIQGAGMSIHGEDYHWDGHQLRMSWTQDSIVDLPEGSILFKLEAIGPGCASDPWPEPTLIDEDISAEIYSGLLETNGLLLIPEENEVASAKDENVQTILVHPNPFKDELQIRWHHAWHGPVMIRLLDISGREWYTTNATSPEGGEGNVQIDSAVIGRMPPGLYLVEVRTGSGRWIEKIVRL